MFIEWSGVREGCGPLLVLLPVVKHAADCTEWDSHSEGFSFPRGILRELAILDGCVIRSWATPRLSKVKEENLGAVPLNDQRLGSGKPREILDGS
jgi:hypothetical protein